MYTIRIYFEQPGLEPVTLRGVEAGQSLLEVCLKHQISLRHNCGGICSCRTCHLYVAEGGQFLEPPSRKEADFIHRAVNPKETSRLGCQSLLLEGKGELEILIPDQKNR